nr:unnamed protein product [Callosobruchus chinensis]
MTQLFENRSRYNESDLLIFCLLSSTDFEFIISLIGPKIKKKNTNFRECIPVNERFTVTLRFLATGDSYTSLMYTSIFPFTTFTSDSNSFDNSYLWYLSHSPGFVSYIPTSFTILS